MPALSEGEVKEVGETKAGRNLDVPSTVASSVLSHKILEPEEHSSYTEGKTKSRRLGEGDAAAGQWQSWPQD